MDGGCDVAPLCDDVRNKYKHQANDDQHTQSRCTFSYHIGTKKSDHENKYCNDHGAEPVRNSKQCLQCRAACCKSSCRCSSDHDQVTDLIEV